MRTLCAFIVLFLAVQVGGQSPTDFTGHWLQQTTSGTQRRLDVKQKGENLEVKTIVTNSEGTRNLEVKYEIGGRESTYKGFDGDDFRTSVRWNGSTLVFDTVELEDGSEILQKAVWVLSEDGNALQVDRQVTKSGKAAHSLATFVRQP